MCDVAPERLEALAGEVPGIGTTVADVAHADDVDRLFDDVRARLGGLDILVNNAGIAGPTAPLEDVSVEDWRRTLAVNLDGQFLCLRRAVPMLKAAGGGSIVNIASTAGLMGFPLRSPYAASKWAVVGLTKTLAMELDAFGIRVNAVCPGSVEGERIDRVIAAEAVARGESVSSVRERHLKQSSRRTFIGPGDVAKLVLFVCSDSGAKISGQALSVDGHTETLGG